jgi:hypothetical protein
VRLWTLHPKYLDTRGLLALWRETLLAQKALKGETIGYKNHPQLRRFKAYPNTIGAIATYLHFIYKEAVARGYNFNKDKIQGDELQIKLMCTMGQILFEWKHLKGKLEQRDRSRYGELRAIEEPEAHPMFYVVGGEVEEWEVGQRRI